MTRQIAVIVLWTALAAAAPRDVAGWQFNVDGATDEAGPCHPDGCGYQREGAVALDVLPSGDVVIGGSFRELGNEPGGGQAHHNVASAGVARVSLSGLGSEVWRHSPILVAPIYTQPDPFFPAGMCHLGLVPLIKVLPGGDVIAFVGPCKQFPAPASELVVRLDGATGTVEWVYADSPHALEVHGTTLFMRSPDRVVALDVDTGMELWTKTSASLGMSPLSLVPTSGGDVVVRGSSGGGPAVQRLAGADGTPAWTYTLTTPNNPQDTALQDIALTPADDVVLAATLGDDDLADFGVVKLAGASGLEQWRFSTAGAADGGGASTVVVDSTGNVYAGGVFEESVPNGQVAAVVKLSAAGAPLWTRTFESSGNALVDDGLAVDSAGDLLVLLRLIIPIPPSQRFDPAIAKLAAPTGDTLWLRRPVVTGALATDYEAVTLTQLRVTADDHVVAAGSIFSQKIEEYDYDGFVFRVWPAGQLAPCFDGNVDPGEACDDGNTVNGDGCDRNCTVSACGNGIAAGAEACDDGNAGEGDGCDSDCSVSACGNGITGGAEACDDGNLVNGDGCDVTCTLSVCGNGIAAGAEACDDGNLVNGDACDINCTVPACGNGVVAGGEACDDGNLTNGDGCESNCSIAGCGNGIVAGGETCDDGNLASGDGCDANCVPTGCGNGIVTAGETCDDGNPASGDGCDATCKPTGCGNGIVTVSETCDDGNPVSGDGCDATCKPTGCGSGVVTAGEQCDDGNLIANDGCESACQFTVVSVAETVAPGGTVSTDTIGGATPAYPAQASVTTATGGDVSIVKTATGVAPQSGFNTLGMVIQIDAPPAASAAAPLQIELVVDASVLPPGATPATVEVFKDGALVVDCTGPLGQASPDPCVSERQTVAGGDIRLLILSTTASAWAVAAPTHDALVRTLKPFALRLAGASLAKTIKVQVINGDPKGTEGEQNIQLAATSDCPGSTLSAPDFDADTAGVQDTVTLAPGKKGTALATFSIEPSGVTGINARAPVRCSASFVAALVASPGVDPHSNNDIASVDIDIYDDGDPGQVTAHETVLAPLKPIKVKFSAGATNLGKTVKLSFSNADILPVPEVGHQISVTASDGTCPAGTISAVDADATVDGIQTTVQLDGGGKGKGEVVLALSAADFTSGSSKAPARCVALVSATGPGGETGVANDTARLVIDVFDKNDY